MIGLGAPYRVCGVFVLSLWWWVEVWRHGRVFWQ